VPAIDEDDLEAIWAQVWITSEDRFVIKPLWHAARGPREPGRTASDIGRKHEP